MYVTFISVFILILMIVIIALQNNKVMELKFISWQFEMSITALIFYSAIIGGAIVSIITLPKLVSKSFKIRSLNKGINTLKKKTEGLEKKSSGKPADVSE
ncbi:lipopolysaccharide assembly protein LapA domain-containing protein [Thermodesulfobacteriota bacterium]